MDCDAEMPSIEERLREVARSRTIAAALLHGAAAADVEDVLQEASIAALAPGAPRSGRFVAWLHGAVRHLARTTLRRRMRRAEREKAAAAPIAQPSAAELAHRLARHRELLAAIEQLSDPIRATIVRRYLDEVPPRTIAKELGLPLATVKTRLRRGLAQLRERLSRAWGEELGGILLRLASANGGAAATAATATSAFAGTSTAAAVGVALLRSKMRVLLAAATVAAVAIATLPLVRPSRRSDEGASGATAESATRGARSDGTHEQPAVAPTAARVAALDLDVAIPKPAPPGSRRARLGATRVASISGRVVDEESRGCGGVEVTIVRPIEAELNLTSDDRDTPRLGERHVTTSTGDGSFLFDDLVRGSAFDLFADTHDGRRASLLDVQVGGDEPATLSLEPTTRIEGVVVDARDGTPVPGATVRVRNYRSDGRQKLDATAEKDGRFTIPDVAGDRLMMFAAAPDGRCSGPCSPRLSPGGSVEIKIEVGRAGAGDGTVVDAESGEPIPDAEIRLRPESDVVAARTDEAGAFRIRPPNSSSRGVVDAVVTAPDHASAFVELRMAKEPDDAPPSTVVKLRRGRVAKGRLVARDGAPIGGAVLLARWERWPRSSPFGVLATTGADGSFRLAGIDPAQHHILVVRHDDCESTEFPFPSDALTAMEIDLGTLVVGHGAFLSGVVANEAGEPMVAAYVKVERQGGEMLYTKSDARGRFAFHGLPAGSWKVSADAQGFSRPAVATLEVHDDETVEPMTLKIPTGLAIAGQVVDVTGAPSLKAKVVLWRVHDEPNAQRDVPQFAHVGNDGRFRFSGLEPGVYRLDAQPYRSLEMRSTSTKIERVDAGTTDLQVILPDGTFATGKVVDGRGKPIIGAMLALTGPDGKGVAGGHSEGDGIFKIPVPPDVELRIDVRVDDRRHPRPVSENPVAASLDHVRGGGAPVTLVVETK